MKKLNVAVVGLGHRGLNLIETMVTGVPDIKVCAVCDKFEDLLQKGVENVTKHNGEAPYTTTDFNEILQDKNIDAVVITTGWRTHVKLAIAALNAGKATAMEVGGAFNEQELWDLVDTWERTQTPFMFLENCCYGEYELMLTNMIRKGMFGDIVHCHGAYAHDIRTEVLTGREKRHYRLEQYMDRNCDNYPTHELGPIAKILGINRGNRMVKLVSVASRQAGLTAYVKAHPDTIDQTLLDVDFKQGDVVNTTIICEDGSTISLKLDTSLPRFYSRELSIHGTKGLYNELAHTIFFDGEDENKAKDYHNNEDNYLKDYSVPIWKEVTQEDRDKGHGGMDLFELIFFAKHVLNNEVIPVDVYDAAAWMCISYLSAKSIEIGGFVDIPDFTRGKYKDRPTLDVVPLE